ncbi:translation initiation factor IF-2 [Aliterella atlantica]|uniref:Translation initiation factor IF-2 n=1 Tax=Aliterella atlantica CENA595 TaxID=1618023 RepID=A0A0D8ZQE6_9CYAN|nr:translation initiation factor IF-2 [Aliterella atlantica CENA595]
MNNGKVRIYDLSKELNLDNKDILSICDQLNIAVKSHSSTISESEAERIRSAAEKQMKQPASVASARKESAVHAKNIPAANINRPKPAPNKQQILEIRKPKIVERANQDGSEPQIANSSESQLKAPSQPRPHNPPPAPIKPAQPNRSISPNAAPKEALETQSAAPDNRVAPIREREREIAQPPQPIAPPNRPAVAKVAQNVQLNIGDRPILRKHQQQNAPESAVGTRTETPERPTRRPPGSPIGTRTDAPVGRGQPGTETNRPKVGRVLEPISPKPVRPKAPSIETEIGAIDEDIDGDRLIDETEELLQRPTLPRPVKGGVKKWQEEEIDEGQDSIKPGKAAAKLKRLKPIIDLEEEEELADELGIDAPVQVSLSVARPPKQRAPKQAQQSSPAAPTTAAVKSKKTSSRSDNRRRSEPEQKRDRPEKIIVTGTMTVQELANELAVPDTDIVKILFIKGMAVNITQNLDIPTVIMVAGELGVEVETAEPEAEARKVTEMVEAEDLEHLQRRPPVVTIMGHVDHGKTTLLDSIRKTKVAQGEAGGITQHIGAYHVDIEHDGKPQQIVFLDTPGHEAFTAMRARGARVTDIAVLVVAADDGVRPQTIEAISHAQAAEVPIVVAINKIDKEGAQPDRVKQELTQYGLTPEEWGGETIMTPVSAIKGENLDTLLEMLLLVAEVEELSANPDRLAKGTVVEAHLDKAKGSVATLLVQNGTLRVGDVLVAGSAFGKVRAMVDDRGQRVDAASPSFAVEVLGLSEVPAAGDEFDVFENEKEARAIASDRADKQRQSRLMQGRATLTTLSAQAQEGELKELNLIVKADVQGSLEAIVSSLRQLPQNEVQIRLLLAAPGEITETDIDLAAASNAVIVGFNTTLASGARQAADEAGVDVREYNIIYKLLEDIQGALEGLLEPELVEEPLGQTEVRAVFTVGRGAVAGCYVLSGKLVRNCKVRVNRGGKVVFEGSLDSLKRMKEDVREVNAGYECGIGIDKFNDWAEGDIIDAYQMVTKRRTLTLVAK